MRTRLIVAWAVVCFLGVSTGAQTASTSSSNSTRCASKKYKFSFTIPGGWRALPQQQLNMMRASMGQTHENVEMKILGGYGQDFVMGNATSALAVAVAYYRDGRRISKYEIKDAVRQLTGTDLDKIKRWGRRSYGRNYELPPGMRNISNLKTRDVSYSDKKKRLIWDTEATAQGGASARMVIHLYFGKSAYVMVLGGAPIGQFSKVEQALAGVDKTFRFEPGAEFEDVEWYKQPIVIIGLIAAGIVVLSFAFRRRV